MRAWYRREGRLVTIVMPTYGDPSTTIDAVARLQRTLRPRAARIVIVDDGSAPEHQERLRALAGGDVEVELSPENRGYAASVNRGLARAGHGHDIVVLNNDVIARRGWLEALQHAAYRDRTGVVGPMLLYPDGRIQAAGAHRNLGRSRVVRPPLPLQAPEPRAGQRARHRPGGDRGLHVPAPSADRRHRTLRRRLPHGLRGRRLLPARLGGRAGRSATTPDSRLTHVESPTRGTQVGERERRSQDHFWSKWGDWFDARDVRAPDGNLRIVYVTEGTGVGGGHRDVFEHLNRLRQRGHSVELYSLGGAPDWFELEAPVRTFGSYEGLASALGRRERHQGRHLVGHRALGVAGVGQPRPARSTSCRTSRPPTTRATSACRIESWRATERSFAT